MDLGTHPLSVIMMDELSDGTAQRLLTEENHPIQALALEHRFRLGANAIQSGDIQGVPGSAWQKRGRGAAVACWSFWSGMNSTRTSLLRMSA